jgi:hypothetical protein
MGLSPGHDLVFHNENLLFVNPVWLALVPAGIALARGRVEAISRVGLVFRVVAAGAMVDLVAKVLPWFDQDNWMVLAVVLPVSVLSLALRGRELQPVG